MTSQTQGPPFIPRDFPTRPSDSERLEKIIEEEHAATKAKCISTIDLHGAQDIIPLQRHWFPSTSKQRRTTSSTTRRISGNGRTDGRGLNSDRGKAGVRQGQSGPDTRPSLAYTGLQPHLAKHASSASTA